ncbi:TerC/Alx family metal homeostasis membrane protein [Patescibacteria group bacterium]|nr:MAG: TerC/Alx family metal homeostasis membrane protein [Patescibacteria group bacterium]
MIPLWFIVTTTIALLLILAFDIFLAFRRPHVPPTRESVAWIIFYVTLAILFGLLLWTVADTSTAGQFIAAWLSEYSLSIDNLFIFLVIMVRFAVPQKNVQEILMVGIILALIFRVIFIVVGVQLINDFSWMFYIFGLLLLYSAANQLFTTHKDEEHAENRLIRWLRRRVPVTARFHGARLRMSLDGRKVFTPALLVFVTLGTTDAILALDSVPVAFGITQNIFIIIAANIFALMGLRQLYFLLGTLVRRLAYLKFGISAILIFIAIKLFITALRDNSLPFVNGGQPVLWFPDIPTSVSLGVILVSISVAIIASLVKLQRSH